MDLGLAGSVAVVTGASRGIGLAITRSLVEAGARVVAGVRRPGGELADLAAGGQVAVVTADLSDPDGPARLVAAAGDRVDVLVNNVGVVTPRLDGFLSVTDEQWRESVELNLMAAVRACRAVLPLMVAAGHGTIVNISSVNAQLPDPLVIDYSAAKGALTNFAKSLSKEFGPKGIRVNTIHPGPVATDLWLGTGGVAERVAAATGHQPDEISGGAVAGTATGRFTQPAEVADLACFLAGTRSANMTGAVFTIDGGLITTL
jgi:NAD(P)-dependent dehydrogenase (short-subunit alcohol dehydrogenase family)